jgi:uncharacterized protein (TIGR04222 family)
MDWLLHNPIADMYGPTFLLFYFGVAIFIVIACRMLMLHSDPSAVLPDLPIPKDPNAYEIAYLRGGEVELIRTVIFNLIHTGFLALDESSRKLKQSQTAPDARLLSSLEQRIFDYFKAAQEPREVVYSAKVNLKPYFSSFENHLTELQLLKSPAMQQKSWQIMFGGAICSLGLAAYKIVVALSKGRHNIGILIFLALLSLPFIVVASLPPRLSKRGRNYLENLKFTFLSLPSRLKILDANAIDPTMLICVGVFGVSVLAGTSFGLYESMFTPMAGTVSSSCGSSCSSASSCGGSSCGSSCGGGGCGGGGCGGCGGS